MSFDSVLDRVGQIAQDIFKDIPEVVTVAEEAEPIIAIALPEISPLYNETVSLVRMWEAAAAANGVKKAGARKKKMVLTFLKPFAVNNAASMGIVTPTDDQLSRYVDNIVADQKTFQALPTTK